MHSSPDLREVSAPARRAPGGGRGLPRSPEAPLSQGPGPASTRRHHHADAELHGAAARPPDATPRGRSHAVWAPRSRARHGVCDPSCCGRGTSLQLPPAKVMASSTMQGGGGLSQGRTRSVQPTGQRWQLNVSGSACRLCPNRVSEASEISPLGSLGWECGGDQATEESVDGHAADRRRERDNPKGGPGPAGHRQEQRKTRGGAETQRIRVLPAAAPGGGATRVPRGGLTPSWGLGLSNSRLREGPRAPRLHAAPQRVSWGGASRT